MRVFRVLKLGQVSDSLPLLLRGLSRSADFLPTLMVMVSLTTILFGTLIFVAEGGFLNHRDAASAESESVATADGFTDGGGGTKPPRYPAPHGDLPEPEPEPLTYKGGVIDGGEDEDEVNPFGSVPETFWFVLSELTTVGNARKSPSTIGGQTLAMTLMCCGVVVLSFCQAIIVQAFNDVIREHRKEKQGNARLRKIYDQLPEMKVVQGVVHVRMLDIYHAVRRSDPELAKAMETLPADHAVSFTFLQVLVAEAKAKANDENRGTVAAGGRVDDLESMHTTLDLMREDQDVLRENLAEQSRRLRDMHLARGETDQLLRAMAVHFHIPLPQAGQGYDGRYQLPDGKRWHFFISHCQATGGDQAALLCTNLEARGAEVWYDMKMKDIQKQAMEDGVAGSAVMIILLTPGYTSRKFCQMELDWAEKYKLKFVGVFEDDERRGKVDFVAEKAACPDRLSHMLDDVEFLAFRRRQFEAETMYDQLIDRSDIHLQPEPESVTCSDPNHEAAALSRTDTRIVAPPQPGPEQPGTAPVLDTAAPAHVPTPEPSRAPAQPEPAPAPPMLAAERLLDRTLPVDQTPLPEPPVPPLSIGQRAESALEMPAPTAAEHSPVPLLFDAALGHRSVSFVSDSTDSSNSSSSDGRLSRSSISSAGSDFESPRSWPDGLSPSSPAKSVFSDDGIV